MKGLKSKVLFKVFVFSILIIFVSNVEGSTLEKENIPSLRSLLPEVAPWKLSEAPRTYVPETLYEYIDGAAEIYLSYDFLELIVAQYKKAGSSASLTVEIYNMGNEKNSFGIYSAERFPESTFVSIGTQGYLEEGSLNFLAGKYYIKLLCFDCGSESGDRLKLFSQEITKRIKAKPGFPSLLQSFPREGLILNSEKYISRNFLGYSFLHSGYTADYKLDGLDFECFLIEGENEEDAQNMLEQYLKVRRREDVQQIGEAYRIKDRYYHNIYLSRIGNYLCGVTKIKDGFESVGQKHLKMMADSLKTRKS